MNLTASPSAGTFLTQDTYRGSLSRTSTLNYYAYCAGNPISYTDPSGHAAWAVAGAALGAYDGYKYAKNKNLKGWKKAAAIVGGAVIGAVNPFKVVKAVKTVSKVYKASKYTKAATSAKKTATAAKKVTAKPKQTVVAKKSTQTAVKTSTAKKTAQTVKAEQKTAKAACFTAGTKIHTEKGFKNIEAFKAGDYVWSENPETKEKALKKVKKIFVREKDSIIRLAINGEVIETTDEHPVFVEGKGFTESKRLKAGDEVRLATGDTAEVETIEKIQLDKTVKVYNFEVEDYHTYYVSGQKVLVHNTCSGTEKNTSKVVLNSPSGLNVDNKRVYRVMSEQELQAVKETGYLRGGREGRTFFTDSYYKSADKAKNRLSLPEKPSYIMEFEIVNNPTILGGNKVKPKHGGIGGGREYYTDDLIQVKIINYQKLR